MLMVSPAVPVPETRMRPPGAATDTTDVTTGVVGVTVA
jgi:hypothetical protein